MRANLLTDVAAVEKLLLFDDFGEVCWNIFFVFNGKVRDTKTGIDYAWGNDGAGGAGVNTLGTVSADFEVLVCLRLPMFLGMGGFWKGESGDNFRQEEPGSVALANEAGIFANCSEAGLFGKGAL